MITIIIVPGTIVAGDTSNLLRQQRGTNLHLEEPPMEKHPAEPLMRLPGHWALKTAFLKQEDFPIGFLLPQTNGEAITIMLIM